MQQERDHDQARRTDASNQRNVALQHLPDRFQNIDTTRVTRIVEPEETETIMNEEEWLAEYKRRETMREGGKISNEENKEYVETIKEYKMEFKTEYVETVAECKVEFKNFLSNIRKEGKEVHKEPEQTSQLSLRPEWAKDKEDMYPQWKIQKENEQTNAPKISGCDVMEMEELTNETVSKVLSPGIPARNKEIIELGVLH